jgi:hypothetical protein
MKTYRLTCAEESTVNYYVDANSEEEATEKLFNGDYTDYDTLGSSIEMVVEIEELGG